MELDLVVKHLAEKNITVGAAESITGGMFASMFTSIPGSSKVFKGSIVSYSTVIKENLLDVGSDLVNSVGVISKECALKMAKSAKKLLGVDMAISFTGNAGPEAMEGKPIGLVYLGIAYQNKVNVYKLQLSGSRKEIREKCCEYAFRLINEKII